MAQRETTSRSISRVRKWPSIAMIQDQGQDQTARESASQVKIATCTLQDDALTWWNAHVKTTTPEVAYDMPWATLKKMMTDKYCPGGMFPEEIDKIEKYIGGLPDMIHGSVKASKPKTMQEAIEFTNETDG
ncbi:hypothetical protein Tco_1563862 [Tanacetum coccineum]